jgi:hypothetical protein
LESTDRREAARRFMNWRNFSPSNANAFVGPLR